jgi:hypothetical protein
MGYSKMNINDEREGTWVEVVMAVLGFLLPFSWRNQKGGKKNPQNSWPLQFLG